MSLAIDASLLAQAVAMFAFGQGNYQLLAVSYLTFLMAAVHANAFAHQPQPFHTHIHTHTGCLAAYFWPIKGRKS